MTTDQTPTWHPQVGHLARDRRGGPIRVRAVMAVGGTRACLSCDHSHSTPYAVLDAYNLIRVCPEGHDWGGDPDGDVCETCHPPRVIVVDPEPVGWANFYDDGDPSMHYTEAAARRHADADPVDAIEVAVPLYRQAQP